MKTAWVLFHLMATCVLNILSVHMKTSADPEEIVHGLVSIITGVTVVKEQKPPLPTVAIDVVTSFSVVLEHCVFVTWAMIRWLQAMCRYQSQLWISWCVCKKQVMLYMSSFCGNRIVWTWCSTKVYYHDECASGLFFFFLTAKLKNSAQLHYIT